MQIPNIPLSNLAKSWTIFCLVSPSHPPSCASGEVLITYGQLEVRKSDGQIDGIRVSFGGGHGDTLFQAPIIEVSAVAVPGVGESFTIHVDKNDIDVFEGRGPMENKTPVGTISIGDIVFTPALTSQVR